MTRLRYNTTWVRDEHNPVLPPQDPHFDSRVAMNPWVMDGGDHYQLYYAGEGEDRQRRICLATAPRTDPTDWTRHGPQFERGETGDFDGDWCVLPHVIDVEPERRRIYYTGNSGIGRSLDRFPGLGFAESDAGGPFRKSPHNPVIPPSRTPGEPDQLGIAGGSVLRVPDAERPWRFYYTGCPTVGGDVFLDQQKTICLATSVDGVSWRKEGMVMARRDDHDYEDIAVAGPVVRQHSSGIFQMWYSAIGSRWGFYSICYAESEDGLEWHRGDRYGDNLQLGPRRTSMPVWDGQMVEYPSVIDETTGMRLFYTGNGYGRTGIGTAVSTPLRATVGDPGSVQVTSLADGEASTLRIGVELDGQAAVFSDRPWRGPDPSAAVWTAYQIDQCAVRHTVHHTTAGLQMVTILSNHSDADQEVRVSLDTGNAKLEVSAPVSVVVPARGNLEVETAALP